MGWNRVVAHWAHVREGYWCFTDNGPDHGDPGEGDDDEEAFSKNIEKFRVGKKVDLGFVHSGVRSRREAGSAMGKRSVADGVAVKEGRGGGMEEEKEGIRIVRSPAWK